VSGAGALWWHHDPSNGTISKAGDPDVRSGIGNELSWLTEPAALMGVLRFTRLERGEQAGRPTLRAVGRPRGGGPGAGARAQRTQPARSSRDVVGGRHEPQAGA